MGLKEQIEADIVGRYGQLNSPDFRFVAQVIKENPYSSLLEGLKKFLLVDDFTDFNDDVGLHLGLCSSDGAEWFLRISYVGPYCVLVRQDGKEPTLVEADNASTSVEKNIVELCESSGLTLVPRVELERPIPLALDKTDSEYVRVFQALFCDTEWMPWERLKE